MTIKAGRYYREGTHGQFKPGYYRTSHREPRGGSTDEVVYSSANEEGWGATLSVSPATESPYGRYGFYDDNDPRNDPDYFDEDQQPKNLAGLLTDSLIDDDVEYEPESFVQGELFKQSPGMATSLMANKESSMRTLSLLGMAERHQTRNYGPATVSSSLTPDSFGLLTKIAEVEKDKENKTVAWYGKQPTMPTEPAGEMRPGPEDYDGNRHSIPLHAEGLSDFPSDMLRTENVEHHLDVGDITQFTEAEVKEGKQFVRDQWTNIKKMGKRNARMPRQLTRDQALGIANPPQQTLFPRTTQELWGATYDHV